MLRRVKTDKDDATGVVVCQGVDEWADLSDGSEIGLAGTTTGEEMKPDPLKPEQRRASFNHRRKGDTDINLDLIQLSVENPWIKIIGNRQVRLAISGVATCSVRYDILSKLKAAAE